MTSEITIDIRAELASAMITCAQGLGASNMSMWLGPQETKAMLTDTAVRELTQRLHRHPDLAMVYLISDFTVIPGIRWHLCTKIDISIWEEFVAANPSRVHDLDVELTRAEAQLTIEKEIRRAEGN